MQKKFSIGDHIAKFKEKYSFNFFDDEIGKGGYGIVYKVKNENTNEILAMKVISLNQFNNEEKEIENAINEVKLLNKINHPFIIKAIDYEITATHIKYVMENCEMNMSNWIKQNPKQDMKFINGTFFAILDALYYLKKNFDVSHRDVKLQNILLNSKGIPKLADFGTAKKILKGKVSETAESHVGTLYFMAPELRNAFENDDFKAKLNFYKCDMFSLGLTFLALCAYDKFHSNIFKGLLNKDAKKLEIFMMEAEEENVLSPEMVPLLNLMLMFMPTGRPDVERI